jgi:hypothetical protein
MPDYNIEVRLSVWRWEAGRKRRCAATACILSFLRGIAIIVRFAYIGSAGASHAAILSNAPDHNLMDLAYLTSHWAAVPAALPEIINRLADSRLDFQPYVDARHEIHHRRESYLMLGTLGQKGLDV